MNRDVMRAAANTARDLDRAVVLAWADLQEEDHKAFDELFGKLTSGAADRLAMRLAGERLRRRRAAER